MRACLLAVAALVVFAATGCHSLAKRGDCGCAESVGCAKPVGCAEPVSCSKPIGCAAAVSPAAPAGVSPYDPGVAPSAPAPYDPGYARMPRHRGPAYGGPAGPPSAQVAYPYYTIRGPRDFLLDNPPSIGR
jgi:hypothetical protein